MVINVYDNQKGYCQMLEDIAPNGIKFKCIGMNSPAPAPKGSLVIFFLSDEIEFMDFVKLYNPEINLILCGNGNVSSSITKLANIKYVDINLTREDLIEVLLHVVQEYKLKTPVE